MPLASPLFADLSRLPPIYLQVSDAEMLYSDAVRFEQQAKRRGTTIDLKIYHQLMHSWHLVHAWMPEAKQAMIDLAYYILKTLSD